MAGLFKGDTEVIVVRDLKEAVTLAAKAAKAGETVLFSPACASFDMFKDYADRGEKFMELVKKL